MAKSQVELLIEYAGGKVKHLLIVGLLAVSLSAQAGELYRWVDEKGKVHYGDAPPPVVDVEKKKFSGNVSDSDLPYATRRAQQNFPVTLYVADNCTDVCRQARELLTRRGIPFAEKNLVTKDEIDAFKAASGGDNVPALGVGKSYIHGFNDGRWHGELDIVGYPKIAPYRPRPELSPTARPVAKKEDAATSAVAPAGTVTP
ncbi:MAG TPA: glutaredoxin family protein [Gallionellaceae bacterium]|nr:glutaredoxin family protein [Gallionellaceae bacterium]